MRLLLPWVGIWFCIISPMWLGCQSPILSSTDEDKFGIERGLEGGEKCVLGIRGGGEVLMGIREGGGVEGAQSVIWFGNPSYGWRTGGDISRGGGEGERGLSRTKLTSSAKQYNILLQFHNNLHAISKEAYNYFNTVLNQ